MIIKGTALPVLKSNIDTDQIIPARHLTGISKTGLGKFLFEDVPENPLDAIEHEGAKVIITHENFGCGSSREHAARAILDRGFQVVVALSFARIFEDNCYNNGVVPVQLNQAQVDELANAVKKDPKLEISVDVEKQTLKFGEKTFEFELDALKKEFILKGGFMKYLETKVPTVEKWAQSNGKVVA